MARYTDIDLLIDKVEETTWCHINKNGELVIGANSETDIPLYKHSDIKRVLSEAPEADVVEVVRCKDCIHRYTPGCAMWYQCSVCGGQWSWENDDGFCHCGERKD